MLKTRYKSSEIVSRKLNLSQGNTRKTSLSELKSKIRKVIYIQYKTKLKSLELSRRCSELKQNSSDLSNPSKKPSSKARLKLFLSTSLQSDSSNIDLHTIDCAKILRTISTSKKINSSLQPVTSKNSQTILHNHHNRPFQLSSKNLKENSTSFIKLSQNLKPKKKLVKAHLKSKGNKFIKKLIPSNAENWVSEFSQTEDRSEIERNDKIMNHERLMNLKLKELTDEHLRNQRSLEDQISLLKKENHRLSSLLDVRKANEEVKKATSRCENHTDHTLDSNIAFMNLLKSVSNLKSETQKLTSSKPKYCRKCKASIDLAQH